MDPKYSRFWLRRRMLLEYFSEELLNEFTNRLAALRTFSAWVTAFSMIYKPNSMSPTIVELLEDGPSDVWINAGTIFGIGEFVEMAVATTAGFGVETVERRLFS